MRHVSLTALAALALLSVTPRASAQAGPAPGTCDFGTAQADLNPNDVFARVFNTGELFYGGDTDGTLGKRGYVVPKATGYSSVYASGVWIGGRTGPQNTLRVAAATYGPEFNFWPGPLGDDGRPVNPSDCSAYDKIYEVSVADIVAAVGGASNDASIWPVELGAPYFIDTNGDARRGASEPRLFREEGNASPIDFAAGERPDIIGDEGVWWVMNDVGGPHSNINSIPIGVEVRVLAWAFSRSDALGQTTFYRYTFINKSGQEVRDTYVGVFVDPDLGDAGDDYVGSDPESGLGFVYNAAAVDAEYGIPPAVGYDFFQGPIVPDGDDAGDDLDTLGTTAISYFINGAGNPFNDPDLATEFYSFMQGKWGDNTDMRTYGNGYAQTQGEVTRFMFPGDPVTGQTWSEPNPGTGAPTEPDDRRFAVHTGPFVLGNGDSQDIVFGIVFAQGASNLGSITALRSADILAQTAYDAGFQLAPPPPAPPLCIEGDPVRFPGSGNCLEGVSQTDNVTLVWGYPPTSPNYLGQFEQVDALLVAQDVPDKTYNFEGFNVYRYPNSNFSVTERELVETYDIINGITTVREVKFDPELGQERLFITARGKDLGLRYSYDIANDPNCRNFQDCFYGVSAYAYNEFSIPQINESQPTNITVRPTNLVGGITTQSTFGDTLIVTSSANQLGNGNVRARIVDPTQVTGNTYRVEFFQPTNADGSRAGVTTYRIINVDTGQIVVDGQDYFARNGRVLRQGRGQSTAFDGIEIDILGDAGFQTFIATAKANGPLDPPEYSALFSAGFPRIVLDSTALPNATPANNTSPTPRQQVGSGRWMFHQGVDPSAGTYGDFVSIVTGRNNNFAAINGDHYEWRFTGTSVAYRRFQDGGTLTVPFELWNTGVTDDDASDDYRMIPVITADSTMDTFAVGTVDHAVSTSTNDPFTDLVTWYQPTDITPGQAGYNAYANGGAINTDAVGLEVFRGMTLVNLNGGNVPGPYNQDVPENGTIFRIVTIPQNKAGDSFTFSTAGRGVTTPTEDDIERALDRIAAVPNPYLGASSYETGNTSRVIRFTNLPEQVATIRIFTVSGSLVNTLRKEGSSRTLDWDLNTSQNLPVASGMYLVHVEIEGVGERTLKLGVINRRTQIRAF